MSDITTARDAYLFLYDHIEKAEPRVEGRYWLHFAGETIHECFLTDQSCTSLSPLMWQLLVQNGQPAEAEPLKFSVPMERFIVRVLMDLASNNEKHPISIEQAVFMLLEHSAWKYDVCIEKTSRASVTLSMGELFIERMGFDITFQMPSRTYRQACARIESCRV